MGVYAIKPRFQRSLGGAEAVLARWGVHRTCSPARRSPWRLLLVPPIVLGRTALNALDGQVARRRGLARPWGEVLNECGDRLADVALFAGVALAPGADPRLGAATLVLMLLSSHVGLAARAAGGCRQYGGAMGKADRMLLLSAAAPATFLFSALPIFILFQVVVLAGLVLTIVQRLRAAHADLQPSR